MQPFYESPWFPAVLLSASAVFFVLLILNAIFLVILFRRKNDDISGLLASRFDSVDRGIDRCERSFRDEIARNREEATLVARQGREETGNTLRSFGDSLQASMTNIAGLQKDQLEAFAGQLSVLTKTSEGRLDRMRETIEERLRAVQQESTRQLASVREDSAANAKILRDEVSNSLKRFSDSILKGMSEIAGLLKDQLEAFAARLGRLTESNENRMEALRNVLDAKLKQIQEDNSKQLEQMRATVDEKLQGTLEKRLGESFKQVSERLEQVHKGLGEMQTLAAGVGDLKRVLTNVKTRGIWGEIQLEGLLEQILTPDQYDKNVQTKENSGEVVEFAIKLPGRGEDARQVVWLPIDAKFPMEDYQRLVEAQENSDTAAADQAEKMLSTTIKNCAKTICEKYLNPPATTDFGIMFLPTEGLYAEVIRRTWLVESLQRECRVVIAGPTTLAALLNSLQMGFRTLAIEKRSSEVWKLLGAVKAEFGKFGTTLDGVKKRLDQASNTLDDAAKKSRTIERKLRNVQELPSEEARVLLAGENPGVGEDVN